MHKLDLSPFSVKVIQEGELADSPYMLRESIAAALFVPELHLSAVNLLKNNKIAEKVLYEKTDTLLLEEEEYQSLKAGMEAATGFSQQDVEMVRRVLEAPQVNVVEKVP